MSRLAFHLSCVLAIVGAFSSGAADGIWVARQGVGTGGTDWTEWSDQTNWYGGVVAGADGNPCAANLTAAAAQYIQLPNTLTITNFGAAGSSVFRGEGTYQLNHKSYTRNPQSCYLYFPFSFAFSATENYAGFGGSGDCRICDIPTSGTGAGALLMTSVSFRYDLFAKAAGEVRDFYTWPNNDFRMNAGATVRFIAPHGSSTNLTSRWVQTADSPFLKQAAGETPHVLSAGTTVTGDGIPEGAFLKRIFPDGTIELSAAPTNSAAANALTFAAFNAKTVARLYTRLAAYNGKDNHYICVQKYRAEDDFTLMANANWFQILTGGHDNAKFTFRTEAGFLPGRIVMSGVYNGGEPIVYLENCHLQIEGNTAVDGTVTVRVDNSAHTARLTVTNGVHTFGRLANLAGKIVKAGARFVIPDGVVLKPASLVVEEGAIFGGAGRLVYPLSASAILGLVLEDGVSIDDGRSGSDFLIEVMRGAPSAAGQDGDSVWIFDTNALLRVNGTGVFDVLVVGGGGGGGAHNGGGGGGGGVVYTQQLAVASGVYPLNVGMGGKGALANYTDNTSGGNSGVFGLLAYGGGAGGTYDPGHGEYRHYGKAGGSGGGGGIQYPYSSTVKAPGGVGVSGQGHDGGKGFNTNRTNPYLYSIGGGGGGAGEPGEDAWYDETADKVKGGNGGDGVLCEIYGSKYYGGGGGGGASNKAADGYFKGGLGGGGDGGITAGSTKKPGGKGEDGLGGGGGAGTAYYAGDESAPGGDGGRGVVIIRWRQPEPSEKDLPDSDLAVGGAVRHRKGYAIHTFSSDGSFVLSEPTLADILLVGGGGGGGSRDGGGGGGGGVVIVSNAYLLAGSYAVTVGTGGVGAASASYHGTSGTDSVLSFGGEVYDLRAYGGGGGGSSNVGKVGGSGGGGGAPYVVWETLVFSGGAGTPGQGYAGGRGIHKYTGNTNNDWNSSQAGGGGGAGEPGGNGTTNAPGISVSAPGNGGNGIVCDFSGAEVYYGGGGGGGSATYGAAAQSYYIAAGGLGGGGRGGSARYYDDKLHATPGENGVDGLGGGGGGSGGASDAASTGGDGGDGVVIIRYRVRRKGVVLLFR